MKQSKIIDTLETYQPPTLVGPSWLHRPISSAYIFSNTPKPSRGATKPLFHRRNLLYP